MARLLCVQWATLILTGLCVLISGQLSQTFNNSDELLGNGNQSGITSDHLGNLRNLSGPSYGRKGLCRDGWTSGTMQDSTGNVIPVCLKVNSQPLTWSEAQAACRKDFGFLWRQNLNEVAAGERIIQDVLAKGITRFWGGLHSENNRLLWDDLAPNNILPQKSRTDSSTLERQWRWETNKVQAREPVCGSWKSVVDDDDDAHDRRRKKRSSDGDDDHNTDLRNMPNTNMGATDIRNEFGPVPSGNMMSSNVGAPSVRSRVSSNDVPSVLGGNLQSQLGNILGRGSAGAISNSAASNFGNRFGSMLGNSGLQTRRFGSMLGNSGLQSRIPGRAPATGAFQSSIVRQPMSDQLPQLVPIGIQSQPQVPGTGNTESNIQAGGLTDLSSDSDSDTPSASTDTPSSDFDLSDNNPHTGVDVNSVGSTSKRLSDTLLNPTVKPMDLMTSVRKVADGLGVDVKNSPKPHPTESTSAFEKLKTLLQETSKIHSDTDSTDSNSDNKNITISEADSTLSTLVTTPKVDSDVRKPTEDISKQLEIIEKKSKDAPTVFEILSNTKDLASQDIIGKASTDDIPKLPDIEDTPSWLSEIKDKTSQLKDILSDKTDINDTQNDNVLPDSLSQSQDTTASDETSQEKPDKILDPLESLRQAIANAVTLNDVKGEEKPDGKEQLQFPPVIHDLPLTIPDMPKINLNVKSRKTDGDDRIESIKEKISDDKRDEKFTQLSDIILNGKEKHNFQNPSTESNIDNVSDKEKDMFKESIENDKFNIDETALTDGFVGNSSVHPFGIDTDKLETDVPDRDNDVDTIELKNPHVIIDDDVHTNVKTNESKADDNNEDDEDAKTNDKTNKGTIDDVDDNDNSNETLNGLLHLQTIMQNNNSLEKQVDDDVDSPTSLDDNRENASNVVDIKKDKLSSSQNGNDHMSNFNHENDNDEIETASLNKSVHILSSTVSTVKVDDLQEDYDRDILPPLGILKEAIEPHVKTIKLSSEVNNNYESNPNNPDSHVKNNTKNKEDINILINSASEDDLDDDVHETENVTDGISNEQGENSDDMRENEVNVENGNNFDRVNTDMENEREDGIIETQTNQTDQNERVSEPDEDSFHEIPTLVENEVQSERNTAILHVKEKVLELSTCKAQLPSVCFTYEVEVMNTASTCDEGWYGHVLLNTCFRFLDRKMNYARANAECKVLNGRIMLANSKMERDFVSVAIEQYNLKLTGAQFWIESTKESSVCQYFTSQGLVSNSSCYVTNDVVCVKDAKALPVLTTNNLPYHGGEPSHAQSAGVKMFQSTKRDSTLTCELSSAATELPVLWFKDGILLETKDKRQTKDTSLVLNENLVSAMSRALGRHARLPVLQGSYWCEVWDRIHLQRERSRSYAVRFSDVISYHGSMKLPAFSDADALLFNMVNLESPVLAAAEMDMKTVFGDTLPQIQARMPEVTGVFTYIDRVTLGTHVVEYHTYFTLSRDYTGADEAAMYELVKSALLTTLSNREYMSRLPGGTPPRAFSEMHLHSTVSCPATSLQTNRDIYGNTVPKREFSFPRASLGEFVHSVDNCGANIAFPVATARCRGDFNTGAYWDDVKANDCVPVPEIDDLNEAIWGTSAYTDKLSEMARTILDENNAESVMTEVAQITKVAVKFTPTDINKIADVLDHATKLENLSLKVGEAVLRTVDRLLDTGNREVTAANVETKAANRIIKSLERFAENAKIDEGDKIRLVSDNLVVEIWNLKPAAKTVIGLAAESIADADAGTPFKTEHIATVYDKSHLYEANVDAAIELPAEVFQADDKGTRLSNRLTMMVFRKSRLFEAATDDAGRKLNPTAAQLTNINSYIISASIAGRRIEGLKEKVKTIFKPIKTDAGELACVWWDFNLNQMKGGWSQAGCSYDGKVNGRDVCLCDHLTNFAILVDFYGQNKPLDPSHELSLSIITLLGLSLSILGLALTIISYVFFRKLRQGRAQQTLFNLSLSLLLAMLVFLIGVKQTHNNVVCIVVAILLHYLIIVSFMWMLMEAILQYLTFVKILGTYITRFTLKTVLPAWGLPMIPVIAVLSVDPGLYRGGPKYCWMDLPAFFYAFAIPVSVIILTNVIIFIVTVISIFRRGKGLRSNQKKHKMAMTNLQAAITSFILLGLTWLFGYLAIADARLIFQYVFTILNSLQGFFIFVLFVLRKKKVREQWYFICCKGIEKDRVSRSLSSTNSNSTYSNGSARKDKDGRDRDRSDSTKTVQSTFSNGSGSFTNFGYDNTYDYPFNRIDRRLFNRKF